MGICGAKVKIVAEPQQKGKKQILDQKVKNDKMRNQFDDHGLDQNQQEKTKFSKKQQAQQNENSRLDKNQKKDKAIRSGNNIENYGEKNRFNNMNNDEYGYDGQDIFQVQMQTQYTKGVGYHGADESNQDLERNPGDLSYRNEDQKRILNFKKGHIIGRGSYGEVYQCLDLNTGQLYAVKTIRKNKEKNILEKEVSILKQQISEYKKLSHKNIVKYIDTELDEDERGINIIFEFVSGGSIRQMLDKFGKFNEKVISIYTNQVLQGLNYLHLNNVIHRDIKGGNILIDTDGTIKLTDFGVLKFHKKDAFMLQNPSMSYISNGQQDSKIIQSSKPFWTAPEVLNNENCYEEHSDIWSVGCLVIEMITSLPPYYHLNDLTSEEIAQNIKNGNLPNFPQKISDQCLEFLQKTLQVDPSNRASVDELLQLKFIAEPDSIELVSEQYSPNQVRGGGFQSQSSLGYINQDMQMKPMFGSSQNGFFGDEAPHFLKDENIFSKEDYRERNGQSLQKLGAEMQKNNNLLDQQGLQSNQLLDRKNNKKTNENTPISMYRSQQKSNKNNDQQGQIIDKMLQKEQLNFENQMNILFKDSNQDYSEARDEYQQQLITQLKEFEDKQLQDLHVQQQNETKKKEQKEIEDEIFNLIKKKKQNRKQESNTPPQNGNKSLSTFDTSLPQSLQPQIRYQVIFNNPKDNFTLLQSEETIKYNEKLLKKQYNDIHQPIQSENDQSPANNSQVQQVQSFSQFHPQKKQDQTQGDFQNNHNNQKIQINDFNTNNGVYYINYEYQNNGIQQLNGLESIQKDNSLEINKLMILQSDPISMNSLGGLDNVKGSVEDLTLYNFNVDNKNTQNLQMNTKSKIDQIQYKNRNGEVPMFNENKREIINGIKPIKNQQSIIDEQDDDSVTNFENNHNNIIINTNKEKNIYTNEANIAQKVQHHQQDSYLKQQEQQHQEQSQQQSQEMILEDYF